MVVCLLHDNARLYTARLTLLDGIGRVLLTNPPHSPDLASFDYHLFTEQKEF